jgi:hypothetical protein
MQIKKYILIMIFLIVSISGGTTQETITVAGSAIWVYELGGGFRELISLREDEIVLEPQVTDDYVLFGIGKTSENIIENIIYRKRDNAIFHVHREGQLMSNQALGEYLFIFNQEGNFEIVELTDGGELQIVKIIPIPNFCVTYFSDNFFINDTQEGKLVVYQWEGLNLLKYHEIVGYISLTSRYRSPILYSDVLYYSYYFTDPHYTDSRTRSLKRLDLNTLQETDLGVTPYGSGDTICFTGNNQTGYVDLLTNKLIFFDNIIKSYGENVFSGFENYPIEKPLKIADTEMLFLSGTVICSYSLHDKTVKKLFDTSVPDDPHKYVDVIESNMNNWYYIGRIRLGYLFSKARERLEYIFKIATDQYFLANAVNFIESGDMLFMYSAYKYHPDGK